MIKEGQNLAGIEAGLIVQLGGKEREFVQEFGRALRSRTPEQHLIVFNDTRDVYYYKNAVGQDQIPGIDAILQKRAIDKKYIRIVRY
jgi:ERCC4-related helicase